MFHYRRLVLTFDKQTQLRFGAGIAHEHSSIIAEYAALIINSSR